MQDVDDNLWYPMQHDEVVAQDTAAALEGLDITGTAVISAGMPRAMSSSDLECAQAQQDWDDYEVTEQKGQSVPCIITCLLSGCTNVGTIGWLALDHIPTQTQGQPRVPTQDPTQSGARCCVASLYVHRCHRTHACDPLAISGMTHTHDRCGYHEHSRCIG